MIDRLRSIDAIVASRRGEHGARSLGLPLSQVYSVATFYAFFNLKPQGEHVITVCRGTACHTRGSKPLLDTVLSHLGVTLSDDGSATTEDYRFTVKTVACFGQCALAPVIAIDEVIHSKVREDQLLELVRSLQQGGGMIRILVSLHRAGRALYPSEATIAIGMGTCGIGSGANLLYGRFKEEVERRALPIQLRTVGCFGACSEEPLVMTGTVGLPLVLHSRVTEADVLPIIEAVLKKRYHKARVYCKISSGIIT